MDFSVKPQQFEEKIEDFLMDLNKKGYSESTLKGYKSYLRKGCSFIATEGAYFYTKESSESFLNTILMDLSVSDSYKKHTKTAVRRFNTFLQATHMFFENPALKTDFQLILRKC